MQQRLRRRHVRKRMGRKDSEPRRIEELFASAVREKERSNPLADSLGSEIPKGNSFDNPAGWDTFARAALRLDGDDFLTAAIRSAFEALKLDPTDPFSWRILVGGFAGIFFAEIPGRKPGAPQTPVERLKELRAEFEQLKIKNPNISEREAVRLMANKRRIGPEALRKQLRKAQSL